MSNLNMLIGISIYIVSFVGMWFVFRSHLQKIGEEAFREELFSHLIILFCPLLNSIVGFVFFIMFLGVKRKEIFLKIKSRIRIKEKFNLNKLFMIKEEQ